jgi:hypothetical protein
MSDMFEIQVRIEAEKRLSELIRGDPRIVIDAYARENKRLQAELESASQELERVSGKWLKIVDSEGYMDVSEVAEKIRVPYIDPNGKRHYMGRTYFCKLLTLDKILLKKNTGYGLHSAAPESVRANAKAVSKESFGYIKSSVKLNARALEYLDDKYSTDERVWHSTSDKGLYYE